MLTWLPEIQQDACGLWDKLWCIIEVCGIISVVYYQCSCGSALSGLAEQEERGGSKHQRICCCWSGLWLFRMLHRQEARLLGCFADFVCLNFLMWTCCMHEKSSPSKWPPYGQDNSVSFLLS